MKQYRQIREKHVILEICKRPDLAATVTLQPVEMLDVDAAIIFADLLLPVEPMGLKLRYEKGEGPVIANPVRTTAGFTSRPDATTSVQFNYFTQNGDPAFTNNFNATDQFLGAQRIQGIQPLSNRRGFTFSIVRKYP